MMQKLATFAELASCSTIDKATARHAGAADSAVRTKQSEDVVSGVDYRPRRPLLGLMDGVDGSCR